VLAAFNVSDWRALMHAFSRLDAPLSGREVQRLAPLVLDIADAGDACAREIVTRTGAILGEQGRVAAAHAGLALEGCPVVLTGGVLQHPSALLAKAIMAHLPGAVAMRPTAPPVAGALLIAFDALGVRRNASDFAALG
jgi:N-acetylglucosamine kinase-like BadF-type ATPase